MKRLYSVTLLAGLLASGVEARPKPTPLAKLIYPPKGRALAKPIPQALPLDVSRLTSLGEFHLLEPEGHLLPEPRCKALAPVGMYKAGQGLLLYEVDRFQKISPIGTAVVRELHPLNYGRERVVLGFRSPRLKIVAQRANRHGPKELRADWAPGQGPSSVRYFAYPSNISGVDFRDYQRLTEGKIWVGMTREQAKLVMGAPMDTHTDQTAFGWREVWKFPRSFEDHTVLVFNNDQLRLWRDSWKDRLPKEEQWSWQKRSTRNPWVGRDIGF